MSHAIEICGLQKSYGNHIVLHDISCCILQGEIFGLLGVNGSGKTTALECIEGLRRYDKGDITVNGKVGIQLQLASLPAHIKPMEALQLAAKWNQTDIDDEMIGALGIEQLSKKQSRITRIPMIAKLDQSTDLSPQKLVFQRIFCLQAVSFYWA